VQDTYDYTEIDREYDREIARLNRQRRARGDDSDFPVFATSLDRLDEVITEGRVEWGHPGGWDGLPEIDPESDPEEFAEPDSPEGPGLCSRRLHEMTKANTIQGQCRACKNISRKRKRSAADGKPLCWTASHPEPADGMICPCGDVPPEETFIDWVQVEHAVAGRDLFRPLTNAEQLCAITTAARRWGGGAWSARTWLWENTEVKVSVDRLKYLVQRWAPQAGVRPLTATEAFIRDLETATAGQEESHPAA
jgi:hypothetical protein